MTQKIFDTLSRRAIWFLGHPSLSGWLYRTAINLSQHAANDREVLLLRFMSNKSLRHAQSQSGVERLNFESLGDYPEETDCLHLSKHHLENVDHKLLAGDWLTEEGGNYPGILLAFGRRSQ